MKSFIKEWGIFILFILLILLSRLFLWNLVIVDGHSMDPTLANKERLVVLTKTKIDRYDIVVAEETDNGKRKEIVKRVIGMPGDKITFKDDQLYVNNKKVDETYLSQFKSAFKKDKLQKTYSYNKFFQQLAKASNAFTTDNQGNTNFTVTVSEGEYYLLGDDRIVSKDSREVGTFKRSAIKGEVKFRFWPFKRMGILK